MATRKSGAAPKRAKTPARPPRAEKWTAEVLEVFPYRRTGLACLVVQSNEDRDRHLSEVNACADFSSEDPASLFVLPKWIYSMWMPSDDLVYLAHSGKALRRGSPQAPEIVLTHEQDVTRLCGARHGVYVVGLQGYVGHFNGEALHDMPVPECGNIYHVAEAPDGTLYAAGDHGRVFRRYEGRWLATKVADDGDIRHVAPIDATTVLFSGASGICGRLEGSKATRFQTEDHDYFCTAVFRGRVFVGAGRRGLYIIEGTSVVPFKENVFSFKLNANDDFLFASGLAEAARYDGESWLATAFTPSQS